MAALIVAAFAGCARPDLKTAQPAGSASPRAGGSAPPSATSSKLASPGPPTQPPFASPSPSASRAAGPAGSRPVIYSATIAPSVVHNGEAMTWSVSTNSDVVSVTAHVSMYTLPLRREHSGRFVLSFTVPSNVPGIFHGNYALNIVARDQAGATATRIVPLSFQ